MPSEIIFGLVCRSIYSFVTSYFEFACAMLHIMSFFFNKSIYIWSCWNARNNPELPLKPFH